MRVLILSGGAFRGAVQVPVIKHLMEHHDYDLIYGVSVGSINGVMAAQGDIDILESIWMGMESKKDFLRLKWWPFNGIYSMDPLHDMLKKYVSLDKIKIPYAAGIVSFTDGEYYNMSSEELPSDEDLWESILASSCMAGIMEPKNITIDGERHIGCDGGFRNIFPIPEDGEYTHFDVVSCTPLDRMKMKEGEYTTSILSLIKRTIEIFEDEIFDRDLDELKTIAGEGNVRVFAPAEYPGDSLDASAETIRKRFKLGEEAIKNPIIL